MISTSYDIDDNQRNSSASNNDEESIFLSSSSEDEQLINNFTSRKNKDKKRYIAKVNDGNEVDEFSNESDASDLEIPLKREDDCISIDDDDDDDDDEEIDINVDDNENEINNVFTEYRTPFNVHDDNAQLNSKKSTEIKQKPRVQFSSKPFF